MFRDSIINPSFTSNWSQKWMLANRIGFRVINAPIWEYFVASLKYSHVSTIENVDNVI